MRFTLRALMAVLIILSLAAAIAAERRGGPLSGTWNSEFGGMTGTRLELTQHGTRLSGHGFHYS
jgi:hypothetical protein